MFPTLESHYLCALRYQWCQSVRGCRGAALCWKVQRNRYRYAWHRHITSAQQQMPLYMVIVRIHSKLLMLEQMKSRQPKSIPVAYINCEWRRNSSPPFLCTITVAKLCQSFHESNILFNQTPITNIYAYTNHWMCVKKGGQRSRYERKGKQTKNHISGCQS